MTVLVTKRIPKMKVGDITVKPDKKTGWWIEFKRVANLYIDKEAQERLRRKNYNYYYTIEMELVTLGKVVSPISSNWRGLRVTVNNQYVIYPSFDAAPKMIRDAYLTESEYLWDFVPRGCSYYISGVGHVVATERLSRSRYTIKDDKYVRHTVCPAWVSFIELDTLPLEIIT